MLSSFRKKSHLNLNEVKLYDDVKPYFMEPEVNSDRFNQLHCADD